VQVGGDVGGGPSALAAISNDALTPRDCGVNALPESDISLKSGNLAGVNRANLTTSVRNNIRHSDWFRPLVTLLIWWAWTPAVYGLG
jgi:hypothetical protein